MHASFVVANNNKSDIEMDFGDRKFYIPDLNPLKLLDTLGQEKIDKFVELIKREDFLQDVASFLYSNFKEGDSKDFPKTAAYREICENSYPMWFKHLKNLCESHASVTQKMFSKGGGRRVDIDKIGDRIGHYASNFGILIGEIKMENTGWRIESNIYKGDGVDL